MEIITWPISIKSIFGINRIYFQKQNKGLIRQNTIENVEKILDCWTWVKWFASYKCDWCNIVKHIHFTCKSRFCNSCSQPQSDIWMNKLINWRPQKLLYKHVVFTIPLELRRFFKDHRNALKILPSTAANAIMFFIRKQKLTPWILAVIHSFWGQLNRNPHTHIIVTNWAIRNNWTFKDNIYIPFTAIRASRTKFLIKNLKDRTYKNLSGDICKQEIKFLNQFYDYHSKITWEETSRHVHFPEKPCSFRDIIWYIWRYVKRPVIAQSRILDYDWKNVTFNYTDKRDKQVKNITCSVFEFMGLLLQHIPNKYFRMIYYYWAFANRSKKNYLDIIYTYFQQPTTKVFIPKTFAQRMFFFTGKNPLHCTCWWCFHKFKISIPWFPDIIFDTS